MLEGGVGLIDGGFRAWEAPTAGALAVGAPTRREPSAFTSPAVAKPVRGESPLLHRADLEIASCASPHATTG